VNFHDEVNRLLDGFLSETKSGLPGGERGAWSPAADVRETAEDFFVRFDLPGVGSKDVKVSLDGETLQVRGERREEVSEKDGRWHRVERFHGAFERRFELGGPVQADKVTAIYEDGVLEIRVPKAESSRPREIAIQTASR
jgi:HSP20 family protein